MRPNAWRAMLGGLVGTAAMTALMAFLAPGPADLGDMFQSPLSWLPAAAMHFLNGSVVFPLLYTFLLYPILPGRPWLKGAILGVALWLVAQLIVMPMIGAGVFGTTGGRSGGGMTSAIVSLLGHLVYGSLLGAISGPAGGQPSRAPRATRMAA